MTLKRLSPAGELPVLRYAVFLALAWTSVVALSLVWTFRLEERRVVDLARVHARTAIQKDILYRDWNSSLGGLYALASEKTPPSPFLDIPGRDIQTREGHTYTLVHPAYMTRLVNEMGGGQTGVGARITSLRPTRYENAPDPWEAQALHAIEAGAAEEGSVEQLGDQAYFRHMLPVVTEASCLDCHVEEESAVGAVRGGLSVAVPMAPYLVSSRAATHAAAAGHAGLWFLGLVSIAIGARYAQNRNRERQTAVLALKESEARFQTLFHQAPLGYQSLDEQARLAEVNETWLELTGYARDEVIGHNFQEFLAPGQETAFQAGFQKFRERREVHGAEYTLVKKDGSHAVLSLHGRMTQGENGAGLRSHCIFQDVTEQRRMEAETLELERRLRHSQKMEAVGTLAGGVAHDFNNILAGILGNAELLLRELPTENKSSRRSDNIVTACLRAKEVVQQILAFSRHQDRLPEPVDVGQIVEEALKLLKAATPSSVTLRMDLEPVDLTVLADSTQLLQVIMNLCTNAQHALGGSGGTLEVGLRAVELQAGDPHLTADLQPGAYVLLEVVDTGCGMEPQVLERIFEPYYTTKSAGEGSGLGLAVVHGIVTELGGGIAVHSAPEEGTRFSVFLPRLAEGPRQQPVAEIGAQVGLERILLVDDEPLLLDACHDLLQEFGYAVTVAPDGNQALAVFRQDPEAFDLLITDQTMPGMNGDGLIRAVQEIRPDFPALLCTGYSQGLDESAVRGLGAHALVTKPFRHQDLTAAIRDALDGSRAVA